jgi:hypothetical protein
MELKDEKYKYDFIKSRIDIISSLSSILDSNNQPYLSRDWVMDILGFNKHIIRKEKINKIYEQ